MKKAPTQLRSRQTVEAMIEATAQVVAEEGWAATTTSRVAARAGVSVGSLYQYFESREDLLVALIQREIEAVTKRFDAALPELMAMDASAAVRRLLGLAFEQLEGNPRLYAELAANWQATRTTVFADAFEAYVLDVLRVFFAARYAEFGPVDVNTLAFIVSNGAMFVIARFLSREPRGVTKESLIEEMSTLYSLYLESKGKA